MLYNNPLFIVTAAILALSTARAQTPGDRDNLKAVHPGYTLTNLISDGLQPAITGMDFLSDGRLVICTWGGDHKALVPPSKKGEVYIFSKVDQDDPSKITYKKFASGLQEPLGLKIVNDTIYVSERQALAALADKNGNGVLDDGEYRKVAAYEAGAQRHEFFFGLLYKDGWFYGAHSLCLNPSGGTAAVPQPNANRGTYVKIEKATGKTEFIAGGAREPFGMTMTPSGEIFSTDVQGTWNPFNSFTQVRPGRFYGHPQPGQSPPNPWDKMPYNAPAVMLPQTEIANAPGEPAYVEKGIFRGQFLYGDVRYGGIQRIFLEKIGDDYQGAVMRFSAGLPSGVGRLKFGPDGDLYVGETGDPDGNWHELNGRTYGLHKMKANGKTAFEMLSVRSRPKGMEIEFTEPAALNADQASLYEVRTWTYTRTAAYGGAPEDKKLLSVAKAQVDAARKKVYLEVPGLKAGYLVYIRLAGLKSAAGASPWSTEAWYTLNAFGTGEPFEEAPTAIAAAPKPAAPAFSVSRSAGEVRFQVEASRPYVLRVTDARGVLVAEWKGAGPGRRSLSSKSMGPGLYAATLSSVEGSKSRTFVNF